MNLDLPVNTKKWSIIWDSDNGNWTSNESELTVTYQKKEFGSSAGVNFRAQPPAIFPCRAMTMRYRVFFPSSFDFVKGGKLPGLWGGEPGSGGGDWNNDGYSFRVMFRKGGEAVAYVYMCTDQGNYSGDESCKLVKAQGKGFDDIAHHTNGAGIDLWRGKGMQFRKNAWNDVELGIVANSPGKADGAVSLKVNGTRCEFKGMSWSAKRKDVNGLAFASWMGGGSQDYAPKNEQTAKFKDFTLRKLS
jgi:hypothetical protein